MFGGEAELGRSNNKSALDVLWGADLLMQDEIDDPVLGLQRSWHRYQCSICKQRCSSR